MVLLNDKNNIPVQNQNQVKTIDSNGFTVKNSSGSDGNNLPQSKIKPNRNPRPNLTRRDIIKWFIPEVGVVNMYINPESINYNYKKQINSERTKGGFIIQYWGEELPTLNIRGTTGSSGIEGLNVLYQIYRSEQYTFDPVALTMASDPTISGLGDMVNSVGQLIGSTSGGILSSFANGIAGLNPLTQSLMPTNPPTLAALALGIELYYSGITYRGFFNNMDVTESAGKMGMLDYAINFTVLQTRGYRLNQFAFQRDPMSGPSANNDGTGNIPGVPLSYKY